MSKGGLAAAGIAPEQDELVSVLVMFTLDTPLLCTKIFRLHHIIAKENLSIKTGINNLKNEHTVNSAFHLQQSIDFLLHGCYTAS